MNDLTDRPEARTPFAEATEAPADRLSRLWDRGERPALDDFLKQSGPLSAEELASVIRADQRRRWLSGERVLAETYFRACPRLRDDLDSAIDVIYNEFLLRERCGERPEATDYVQRFPEYASVLTLQIEFHTAMAAEGLDTSRPGFSLSADAAAGGARAEARRPLVPGYEVLEELGRGGMGVVYKARHLRLNRIVALKMLLAGAHAGADQLSRFRAEAEAVARLQHPNIVQIYEVGEAEGWPFLALEYVDGGTLKGRLRGTPLPARPSARLVESLARAVHYAHEHGVVHRDLKPANILVGDGRSGRDGSAPDLSLPVPDLKIADFGLAKLLSPSPESAPSGTTHTDTLLGTPSYMAPEQAAGKHRQVGPNSDVYSLGAILYELMTGRPPFQGETPLDTLQQVIADEPVPPARLRGRVPGDLQTICLKCLEKDPLRRYATAEDLADDLHRFGAGVPIAARPVGSIGRAWRWSRRNPRWAGTLAATASLLVVVAVGAVLWSLDRSAALGRAREAEADSARKLYDSRLSEARARSLSRRSGQRFATLTLLDEAARQARDLGLPASHLDELRNATIAALAVPDMHPTLTPVAGDSWADFDDELAVCARCDEAGNTSVRRVVTDVELHAIPGVGRSFPCLSRDARFLILIDSNRVANVWQLDLPSPRMILTLARVGAVDFHSDGRHVAIAHLDGAITLFNLASGEPVHRLPPPHLLTQEPVVALHPTEPLIAVASYFGAVIQIRNTVTGVVEKSLDMPDGCSHVVWHPSGRWLLASQGNGPDIQVFDRATFQRQHRIGPVDGGARMHFNHAGDRLAVSDWSGVTSVKLFDFATGRCLLELPTPRVLNVLRFSRDDQRLAGFSRDGRLGVWEVADGREYRTLTRKASFQTASLDSAAVSPDGRLLAIALGEGVTFWDLATGLELADLPLKGVRSLYFEPGGALVTADRTGTYRWPIRPDATTVSGSCFGPPEPLPLPPGGTLASSHDGRVIASRSRAAAWESPFAGAWVRHPERPDSPRNLDPGADIGNVAVSPDGAWVATAHFHTGPVKIWDTRTGHLEREFPGNGGTVQFSPDGRWFVVGGENSRFYSIADWSCHKTLPGTVAFSPDGRLLVLGVGDHSFSLRDTKSDRELARFEDPNQHLAENFLFSPDGTRLVTIDRNNKAVHVWDLRAIRRQLADRNLDWDTTPDPPAAAADPLVQIRIDMGDYLSMSPRTLAASYDRTVEAGRHLVWRWYYRGKFHLSAGRYESGVTDLRTAVELSPNFDEACNALAWVYATGPDKLRDPVRAVVLGERAVKLRPEIPDYSNTLGIAYYRASRFPEAVTTLTKSLHAGSGQADAYDLYFLALCHHQMGNRAEARDCLDRARTWHKSQQGRLSAEQVDELNRFRTEAEEGTRTDARPSPSATKQ